MVYYGSILQPSNITSDEAVNILKNALKTMYAEERFLGGFCYTEGPYEYRDMNFGDYIRFNGVEKIFKNGELTYELSYCGGTVRK